MPQSQAWTVRESWAFSPGVLYMSLQCYEKRALLGYATLNKIVSLCHCSIAETTSDRTKLGQQHGLWARASTEVQAQALSFVI